MNYQYSQGFEQLTFNQHPQDVGNNVTFTQQSANYGHHQPPSLIGQPSPYINNSASFGQPTNSGYGRGGGRFRGRGRGRGSGGGGGAHFGQVNSASFLDGGDPVAQAVMANMQGSLARKRPAVSSHCDVCSITCCGEEQFNQHMAGSKHAKKLRMKVIQEAEAKKAEATAAAVGEAGASQILLGDANKSKPPKPNKDVSKFFCQPCSTQLNSEQQYQQHIAGAKHMRKVNASGGNKAAGVSKTAPQELAASFVSAGLMNAVAVAATAEAAQ